MDWYRFDRQKVDEPFEDVLDMAIQHELALGNKLKICVGCDSHVKGAVVEFATVLLILRERKGGFMFYRHTAVCQKLTLKERMLTEVTYAIQAAYELCPIFEKYPVALELHADINTDPRFKSNLAFKDVMGYIAGMGYVFKAKPDAFASSCCADRVIH
jgi:predicted RNase H-related nuclease YkuK (DUF458 family)